MSAENTMGFPNIGKQCCTAGLLKIMRNSHKILPQSCVRALLYRSFNV